MGRNLGFVRDDALEAAMRVFWEKGYEGASLDCLTLAMGINRPSLYRTFGNKDRLFRLAMRRYEITKLGFAWRALRMPTALGVCESFLSGFIALILDPAVPDGLLGIHGAIACSSVAEPIRDLLNHRREIYIYALKRRLREARRDGDLGVDVDPSHFARYIVAIVGALSLQGKAGDGRAQLDSTAYFALYALRQAGAEETGCHDVPLSNAVG
ncbi:TetR/AcrR family transcriptional regulator [Sphingomonas abietis]|uniref:TetR/AcrR family transcriptional regulator n=1 Tax=Sphingomonas abietis TaxID=3012344 RepID=A0ABY7NJA9_9SPHN|nr:TetR/AcrR family transcriptional regulator [Sphingomonas abietis]WBO21332.1 TetR/AcrR family transcriptional regulator [Sphingomonas abietis]